MAMIRRVRMRKMAHAAFEGVNSASGEERFDTLYGLVRWGLVVFPLLRVDPRVFAAERRARRPVPAVRPEWRD